jgi:hypothetical protein
MWQALADSREDHSIELLRGVGVTTFARPTDWSDQDLRIVLVEARVTMSDAAAPC